MSFEIDFITLGDASVKLGKPSPTVRHWGEQLEELEVHYLKRNNRNERIYYDEDIKIFEYLRDLKDEYGRRTTTRDLAYMLQDRADKGEFKLRKKEDAPQPANPSNKTADLLNQEDIQRLMQSERVKQFMGIILTEHTEAMRGIMIKELEEARTIMKEEIREVVREEVRQEILEANIDIHKSLDDVKKGQEEIVSLSRKERIEREEEAKKREDTVEVKKGFWSGLFGQK